MAPVTTESSHYNFIVTDVAKAGNSLRITYLLEATQDQLIEVSFGGCGWYGNDQIYALDENGVRWDLDTGDGETNKYISVYHPAQLPPHTRLKSVFLFRTVSDTSGSVFTLTLRQCTPAGGQLIVPNLRAR